jgi:diguanylate cyclase (GGDEF)-like protein
LEAKTLMFTNVAVPSDLPLLLLAVIVCAGGSFTTIGLYRHLLECSARHQFRWLVLAGACGGASIWATHLVALLAFRPGIETSYAPLLTALSFAVAAVITGGGIAAALRPQISAIGLGGAIIGVAVAAKHFISMQAVVMEATVNWNWPLTAISVALGLILNACALIAYRTQQGARAMLSGSALLTIGICLPHFLAVAGLEIIPNRGVIADPSDMDEHLIALAIAGVAGLMLLAGYGAASFQGHSLRESASRTSELLEVSTEGLVIAKDGAIVSMNNKALEWCGSNTQDLIGKQIFGELFAARRPRVFGTKHLFEVPLRCGDQSTIPVEVIVRPMSGLTQGNEVYVIRDLREREEAARQLAHANAELRQREEDLRARNHFLHDALSNIAQGLCMFDRDQRVVISNERFATMYGLPADAIQPGMPLREIIQKRIDNGIYAGESPDAYMQDRTSPVLKAENSLHELCDGRTFAVARRPMPNGGWVTTHEDITDRRRMAKQVALLEHHDALTGLPRRSSLRDRLEEALKLAVRQDRRVAVLVLEIDRFNEVNDTLGHTAGDALLRAIAERLQAITRQSAVLGRFGDHTFAVVEIVEHPGRDAAAIATRLQQEIRVPFLVDGNSVDVTATIGIAASPADGRTADTLLKHAALALNRGKIDGRGRHHFFEAGMDQLVRERRNLARDLAEAVEKQQFELHYQPVVNLARNAVTGLEALLRWRHPTEGLVGPARFLAIAEETQLIIPIGEWTVMKACAQAVRWPNELIVSVNIAVPQFRSPGFIPSIVKSLATTGLNANRLEVEVTEKVIRDDAAAAFKILRQLSDLGVLVALDDFGSGFSSLTYMRQFPFHKIKIDQSFVKGLATGEDSRIIVRTLARLGAGLGMITNVEGIETKEQLDIVRADGCTEMQGYYFSPPKTAEEIDKLFLARSTGQAVA